MFALFGLGIVEFLVLSFIICLSGGLTVLFTLLVRAARRQRTIPPLEQIHELYKRLTLAERRALLVLIQQDVGQGV